MEEGWIVVEDVPERLGLAAKKVAKDENISQADAKTLMLARENAVEILIDEKVLADLSKMFGLKVWSTWTVLLESLRRGLIQISDIESAITELGEKRHKLRNRQATEILEAARIIASRGRGQEGETEA